MACWIEAAESTMFTMRWHNAFHGLLTKSPRLLSNDGLDVGLEGSPLQASTARRAQLAGGKTLQQSPKILQWTMKQAQQRYAKSKVTRVLVDEAFKLQHTLPEGASPTAADDVHEKVLKAVKAHPAVWARGVKKVLGQVLAPWQSPAKRVKVFTDCSGIEAPLEGLRHLEAIGIVHGTDHIAACELDDLPRHFALRHHRWPRVLLADLLQRDFSNGGCSYDLMSRMIVPVPKGADIYCCGFPCQPWSAANSGVVRRWNHQGAQVIFAMVETLKEAKPRTALLENVSGLISRGAWAGLRELLIELDLYYFCLINNQDVSPSDLGFPISRPRVYILLLLVSEAPDFITSNDDLYNTVKSHLTDIKEFCKDKAGRLSFTRFLSKHGPKSARSSRTEATDQDTPSPSIARKGRHRWKALHKKSWKSVETRKDYFETYPEMRSFLTLPRERDLANLIWNTANIECEDLASNLYRLAAYLIIAGHCDRSEQSALLVTSQDDPDVAGEELARGSCL